VKGSGSLAKIGMCSVGFCMLTGYFYAEVSHKMPGCFPYRVGMIAFFYELFLCLLALAISALIRRKFQMAMLLVGIFIASYVFYGIGVVPSGVVLYENQRIVSDH
jgi:ABC-type transport system involved in multi-copper enzyme maturation permease subunit